MWWADNFSPVRHLASARQISLFQFIGSAVILCFSTNLGFAVAERRHTKGVSTAMVSAVMKAGSAVVVLVQGTEPDSQVSRFVARHAFPAGRCHRHQASVTSSLSTSSTGMGFGVVAVGSLPTKSRPMFLNFS